MAIDFIRLAFKSRENKKTGEKSNAVLHSSYNSRERLYFEGTKFSPARYYNFGREEVEFSVILLPQGVDEKFLEKEYLWNKAEQAENRKDSQVYIDCVIALPDDECVSKEMRKEIAIEVARIIFLSKCLAVQIDIHIPQENDVIDLETGEVEKKAHNHHAHLMATTRGFSDDGKEFSRIKPRHLFPTIRNGRVVEKDNLPDVFSDIQNKIFDKFGIDLRVDPKSAISQKHIGPVRMRGRAYGMIHKNEIIKQENIVICKDPAHILKILTDKQSIFSRDDVDHFLAKHVLINDRKSVESEFWNNPNIVQLREKKNHELLQLFSTESVVQEESKIMRIAERLFERKSFSVSGKDDDYIKGLNDEQKLAFHSIVSGKALTFVEGHAGTGKSYLLVALKEKYESEGFIVRAFGPDHATAKVLEEKGFKSASTIHHTLYSNYFSNIEIKKGKEVWLVDEAGKLGNAPLLELFKVAEKNNLQVVVCGNSAQLPSVSRGGMLKLMCEKFGCLYLENIQRQRTEEHRNIAKKLAKGDISSAFDMIENTGGFIWTTTQKEALESCAKAWLDLKISGKSDSSLIIVHTNNEVRAMNELVRSVRKELQEIGNKEYRCETPKGEVYVSEGDEIEFRKKDGIIGVENGSRGILTHATKSKFTVRLTTKGEEKEVFFDPSLYNCFQLGYAITYNRSQGQTVDRALIVASPRMNKEMFYVGLTRHVREVKCFVSKELFTNLACLKRDALRSSHKSTTYEYTHDARIEEERIKMEKESRIQELKSSGSLIDKTKGGILSLSSTIREAFLKRDDRKADDAFFSYKEEKQAIRSKVQLVENEFDLSKEAIPKEALEKVKESKESRLDIDISNKSSVMKMDLKYLSDDKKQSLFNYFKKSDESRDLYNLVCSEVEALSIKREQAPNYAVWMEACLERNKAAANVISVLEKEELNQVLSKKSIGYLYERREKHIERQIPKESLDDKLRRRMEELVYALFPEGPNRRSSRELRFGSKGSLCITMAGKNAGSFFDFEEHIGGGPLKLIERSKGIDKEGARNWAKEFLGSEGRKPVPEYYRKSNFIAQKDSGWISLVPPKGSTFPDLRSISRHLDKSYVLSCVHTYRDEDGNPLFFVARLNEKETGKKLPLPISYGKSQEDGRERWAIKGFSTKGKVPLYNLESLKKHPNKPILIVEGEKAADAGIEKVGDWYNVLSWCGGAKGTEKSDWTPLFGKDIVIWPDNDEAGFQAADDIERKLKSQGVKSLKVIDKQLLKTEFPEKWDIADPLPNGKKDGYIKDTILRSENKAVSIYSLLLYCDKSLPPKERSEELLFFNEVLNRVENRLSEEVKDVSKREFCEKVSRETSRLIKDYSANQKKSSFEALKLLYIARHGTEPTQEQSEFMRKTVKNLSISFDPNGSAYSFQRAASFVVDSGITNEVVLTKLMENYAEKNSSVEKSLISQVEKSIQERGLEY